MVSGTSHSSLYNELLDAQTENIGRTIGYSYDFCKNANRKRNFKEWDFEHRPVSSPHFYHKRYSDRSDAGMPTGTFSCSHTGTERSCLIWQVAQPFTLPVELPIWEKAITDWLQLSSWNSNLIPIRAACLRSATAGGLLLRFCNGTDPVSRFWWRGLTGIPFTGRKPRMNYRKWPWKKCIGCVMVFHLLRRELLKNVIQRLLYKERICQFAKNTKYSWISIYIPTVKRWFFSK